MNKSKILTITFASITALVAVAIIWQACCFVDSLHNNVQATKQIHINGDNKMPERGRFDAISTQFSDQIDSMSSTQPFRVRPRVSELSGSEKLYEKALSDTGQAKYAAACDALSEVLKLIPSESRTKKAWFADGKGRDKRIYEAKTYEQRGFCYLHMAKYRLAIKDLDESIALRPEYGPNYLNRSKAHRLLGEIGEANADQNRARELPVPEVNAESEHALDDLVGRQ